MPYVIRDNAVYKKITGELVGRSKKPKNFLRVLNAIEHGAKLGKRPRNRPK